LLQKEKSDQKIRNAEFPIAFASAQDNAVQYRFLPTTVRRKTSNPSHQHKHENND
jgi:hypothetical protein